MDEETGAVEAIETVAAPEPAQEAPTPPEPVRDNGDALDRAMEKVGQPRQPDGKFAPKTEAVPAPDKTDTTDKTPAAAPEKAAQPEAQPVAPEPAQEAPKRLNPAALAEWDKAPPALRADVNRVFKELESGLTKYREQVAPLAPFVEMAGGPDKLAAAFQSYKGIEDMLRADPLKGLETVCANMGTSLREVAAHVLGQPAPQRDAEVSRLTGEMTQMQQRLARYEAREQAERAAQAEKVNQTVAEFAADPRNSRFDELSGVISALLANGIAQDLAGAYAMADRLNPAQTVAQTHNPATMTPAQTRTEPTAAQTRISTLSTRGAPGGNPARGGAKTNGDALDAAASRLGIF